jgi:chloramphenicol 3-O-phosphotransferase
VQEVLEVFGHRDRLAEPENWSSPADDTQDPASDKHRGTGPWPWASRSISRWSSVLRSLRPLVDGEGGPVVTVEPCVLVISGLPGVGKSTTARLVASRFDRGAHIEADQMQRMIVAGGVWPDGSEVISEEASAQLALRLHNACLLARSFLGAGFTAVVDDIVVADRLVQLLAELEGLPVRYVMLAPPFEHVRRRWTDMGSPFADTWGWIDEEIRLRTKRIGLWLDTAGLTPEQTAVQILTRLDEANVSA